MSACTSIITIWQSLFASWSPAGFFPSAFAHAPLQHSLDTMAAEQQQVPTFKLVLGKLALQSVAEPTVCINSRSLERRARHAHGTPGSQAAHICAWHAMGGDRLPSRHHRHLLLCTRRPHANADVSLVYIPLFTLVARLMLVTRFAWIGFHSLVSIPSTSRSQSRNAPPSTSWPSSTSLCPTNRSARNSCGSNSLHNIELVHATWHTQSVTVEPARPPSSRGSVGHNQANTH